MNFRRTELADALSLGAPAHDTRDHIHYLQFADPQTHFPYELNQINLIMSRNVIGIRYTVKSTGRVANQFGKVAEMKWITHKLIEANIVIDSMYRIDRFGWWPDVWWSALLASTTQFDYLSCQMRCV